MIDRGQTQPDEQLSVTVLVVSLRAAKNPITKMEINETRRTEVGNVIFRE